MTDREKAQIQAAALTVAEFEHKNDDGIKAMVEKKQILTTALQAKNVEINTLRAEYAANIQELRKVLLPLINANLR